MPILFIISIIVSGVSLYLLNKFILKTFVSSERAINIGFGIAYLLLSVAVSAIVLEMESNLWLIVKVCFILIPGIAIAIWRKSIKEATKSVCGVFVVSSIAIEIASFVSLFASWSNNYNFEGVLKVFSLFVPLFVFVPLAKFSQEHQREPFNTTTVILMTVIIQFIEMVRNTIYVIILNSSNITDDVTIVSHLMSVMAAAVNIVLVMCFVLRSEDKYLKSVIHINDEMLNAQLTHYETIKQSNFELRRIRHDMKNHLLVIKDYAEREDVEGLKTYVSDLQEDIEASNVLFRTGNDIVDAILSDKKAKADKRGIKLAVTGTLAGCSIDSVDICTIIANLLDNAVEAVSKLYGMNATEEEYTIVLEFKRSGNFLFIVQTNYAIQKMVSLGNNRFASSKTSGDHGFGLYNIRKAVERNSGEMNINSEESRFIKYSFEIILPMNSIS